MQKFNIPTPSQGFYTVTNILSTEQCSHIVDWIPEEGTDGWTGLVHEKQEISPEYAEYIPRRYRCDEKMKEYISEQTGFPSPIMWICKYLEGEGCETHVDSTNVVNIKLNNDYTGGDLILKDRFPIDELGVGDAVVFNKTIRHRVKPVTTGIRYSLIIAI